VSLNSYSSIVHWYSFSKIKCEPWNFKFKGTSNAFTDTLSILPVKVSSTISKVKRFELVPPPPVGVKISVKTQSSSAVWAKLAIPVAELPLSPNSTACIFPPNPSFPSTKYWTEGNGPLKFVLE